ncbi:MAG: hypothetical protein A3C11_00035 [Candidatus Sungbacteria bacterium RIFCSPHIGHO2_02_FULL_49_12]|uniref:Uncharacterized protein n=1 Tax=Candidatus Sungbacteria bacterium RIFCSPHIGHO2_02_FULL_49_12 TaxID=1802271 RepID=A0A1G2KRD9_9BACT|nr:MAG: hypothetical protein A3C11_00035 [Candidatus Sungbacteria bacterium RIFCSPHIGHO2_02_FULL_49_12]
MESSPKTKWIYAAIIALAAILAGAVWGPKWASSYYVNQGRQAILSGDFSGAKVSLQSALKYNSANPLAYSYLGRVALGPADSKQEGYYTNPSYPDAISNYEKAFANGLAAASSANYKQALENTGYAYWNLKQYDKADEYYLKQLQAFPGSAFWARYFLGKDYFERLNKPEEALKILSAAPVATNAEAAYLYQVYTTLARLYAYFDNASNTKKYAELAIKSVPDDAASDIYIQIAHILLAQNLAKEKKLQDTLKEYEVAVALAKAGMGSTQNLQCSLARIYFLSGNTTKAIQLAKQPLLQTNTLDYLTSICIEVLARSSIANKNSKDSKKYMQEYIAGTENFEQKNIFVARNRDEFQKALASL